jgi:hypothetical protein
MGGSRAIGLAGVGFVVLTVGRFVQLGATERPDLAGPLEPIGRYLDAHGTGVALGTWVGLVAFGLLLVFVVGLARRAQPAGGLASSLVLAGGILVLATLTVNSVMLIAGINTGRDGDVAEAVRLLRLAPHIDHFMHLPNALWQAALAVLLLRTRVLARPFGATLALLAAAEFVASAVGLAASEFTGPERLPFLGMLLWVLAAGVALLARPGRPAGTRHRPETTSVAA